jgi:NitT/TauT family transport system substrate-binding protein
MNARVYLLAIITVIFFSVTACGSSATTPAPEELKDVSVQLSGPHGAEFAGFYMAIARGYYQNEGLSVNLIEGGQSVEEVNRLGQGKVDFSVYQAAQFKKIASTGDLSTIAAIFQFPTLVFFALSNSGPDKIIKPQDFVGKRIAVQDQTWRDIYAEMMQNVGLDPVAAIPIDITQADMNINQLYSGGVDVWSGNLNREVVKSSLEGKKLSLIFPHEYGIDNYDQLLVTRNDTIAQNQSLVSRFVRATLKGWQHAIRNPEEAGSVIAQWQPANDAAFHTATLQLLIPLIDTGEHPLGWIEKERWDRIMTNAGLSQIPPFSMEFAKNF